MKIIISFICSEAVLLHYCIVLYGIAWYCIVLHFIVLHFIVLHCIALYCIALYCIVLYFIALYCIVLHCIAFYCILLHCIVFYSSHLPGYQSANLFSCSIPNFKDAFLRCHIVYDVINDVICQQPIIRLLVLLLHFISSGHW